ncbi:ROK family transcriptional regulator [Paenarthrobacter sp. TYUT067]|uniref:ROK family transcriptional regulator n=1 Tax=Paenarthrobacter sp. TYUT067 TaxID=2926245 RepID=UPI00202E5E68|nr:ROK family transcriptional regulator [Paenarthrobacter sp. TYUT067]MCM0614978.1 ROK family transcriptional regulator [Paenarthrobacter sp. TYUT067]
MSTHESLVSPSKKTPISKTSGVRRGNIQRVLEALRKAGPSSQAALARSVELSPATVNNIIKVLKEDGVVELQPLNGRESLVALIPSQGSVVSIQVNVTSIHGALFDFGRSARYDLEVAFEEDTEGEGGSPEIAVGMIRKLAAKAGRDVADLAGVSVAMQAPIAQPAGTIASWARLQLPAWQDLALEEVLEAELGVPVVVENDANLAALAEWTWGAGRGVNDFLYVACGSRIGGGLVINGSIYRGGDGMAGEIGHMMLEPNGPVCFCGSRGCLTTVASERSILNALEASGGTQRTLTEVIEAAKQGDPACQRVLYETGRHLGRALASTAKVMAPSMIVIGGLLGQGGSLVFKSLLSSAEVNSLKAVSPSIRFRAAEVNADTTLLGGVTAVLERTGQGASDLALWMKSA